VHRRSSRPAAQRSGACARSRSAPARRHPRSADPRLRRRDPVCPKRVTDRAERAHLGLGGRPIAFGRKSVVSASEPYTIARAYLLPARVDHDPDEFFGLADGHCASQATAPVPSRNRCHRSKCLHDDDQPPRTPEVGLGRAVVRRLPTFYAGGGKAGSRWGAASFRLNRKRRIGSGAWPGCREAPRIAGGRTAWPRSRRCRPRRSARRCERRARAPCEW
jgi:hypothetical protein